MGVVERGEKINPIMNIECSITNFEVSRQKPDVGIQNPAFGMRRSGRVRQDPVVPSFDGTGSTGQQGARGRDEKGKKINLAFP